MFLVRVWLRQVVVMIQIRVSVQEMNVTQCNFLSSHGHMTFCVCGYWKGQTLTCNEA